VAKFQNPSGVSASLNGAENLKFERADWTVFRTVEGLQQKAGVPAGLLRRLVLKEIADNALDNLGALVTVGKIEGGYFVEDDGPGLDPDEVARMFSIQPSAGLDQVPPAADTRRARQRAQGGRGRGAGVGRFPTDRMFARAPADDGSGPIALGRSSMRRLRVVAAAAGGR
jgi:hypothetical protein